MTRPLKTSPSKNGQNPDNTSKKRPLAPKGSRGKKKLKIDIKKCARCQDDHNKLEFKELANSEKYSHYAICPTNGQPVLMYMVEEN